MNKIARTTAPLVFRLSAVAIAAALAIPASAQFGGGMGGGMRRGGLGGERGMTRPGGAPAEAARVSLADSLYQVRMRLLISPEQVPAWEGFYAAFMALDAPAAHSAAMSDEGSAVRMLQQYLTVAQNRYARTEDLAERLKVLYAALTPDQQRTADEVLPRLIREFVARGATRTARAVGG
jgi:hypothetical protein